VVTTLVCLFLSLHARLRVHLASGIPCALVYLGARENSQQSSGAWRREIGEARPFVIARECGRSSTPRLLGTITGVSGMLDRPVEAGR
jgi:hypothetical protein